MKFISFRHGARHSYGEVSGERVADLGGLLAPADLKAATAGRALHALAGRDLLGPPGGVGAKRAPPVWMTPGEVVEINIPGVGLLRNTIGQEA